MRQILKIRQELVIRGDLDSPLLLPWIERHSRRLGLRATQFRAETGSLAFEVEGQPEMIDALEVGCLLGPIDIWVAEVERHPCQMPN